MEYANFKPLPEKLSELETYYDISKKSAFNLLKIIHNKPINGKNYQICTAESLTSGLIMSTLVDIPFGGFYKYGCFGVYETDAKRTMIGVKVDNVYTHKCAKEMAIGILKNTNATIAISVTGNAMPLNEDFKKLGEVFIGIAGYKYNESTSNYDIIYITKSINACFNEDFNDLESNCQKWYNVINQNSTKYNPRTDTAFISKMIRQYTVYKSLTLCKEFIEKFIPDIPEFILQRKEENSKKTNNTENHNHIPDNKYNISFNIKCLNNKFKNINSRINNENKKCNCPNQKNRCNTKEFLNAKHNKKIKI